MFKFTISFVLPSPLPEQATRMFWVPISIEYYFLQVGVVKSKCLWKGVKIP